MASDKSGGDQGCARVPSLESKPEGCSTAAACMPEMLAMKVIAETRTLRGLKHIISIRVAEQRELVDG